MEGTHVGDLAIVIDHDHFVIGGQSPRQGRPDLTAPDDYDAHRFITLADLSGMGRSTLQPKRVRNHYREHDVFRGALCGPQPDLRPRRIRHCHPCLALGIGVNATLFSVVDGICRRCLCRAGPPGHPRQTFERGGIRDSGRVVSGPARLGGAGHAFHLDRRLSGTQHHALRQCEPERLEGAAITWDLFPCSACRRLWAATSTRTDDRPGAEPVVILSHEVWQRRYQGDAGIIGRSISVNGRPHTVVGVMPPSSISLRTRRCGFRLGPIAEKAIAPRALFTFGRLKPGVDLAQARSELRSIAANAREAVSGHQRRLERNGARPCGRIHPG